MITILIAMSLLSPSFQAQDQQKQQDQQERQWSELNDWMTSYYLPRPYNEIDSFLKKLERSQFLEKNSNSSAPMIGFLAVLFSNNAERLTSWMSEKPYSPRTKQVLQRAVWLSGNHSRMEAIFKELPDYASKPATKLADLIVRSPEDLDMLWGAFFASGDAIYIRKLIRVLDMSQPLSGEAKLDSILRKAAAWSLGSNLRQHEKLCRIVQQEIEKRSGDVREQLEDLYQSNRKPPQSFPDHDGEFSAALVVTDAVSLRELRKPASQGLQLEAFAKAKYGDPLAIIVLFSGMEANEAMLGDVRYDLKILDPDGQLYDDTDEKNKRAFSNFVFARFRIYHAPSPVVLVFEEGDKLGKYQFFVEIRDLFGKKKILLKAEVELQE